MADVEVTTLEKVDPSANANKFYRAFYVSDKQTGQERTVIQYGSQRTGRSGGQSKVYSSGGEYARRVSTKRSEGYTNVDQGIATVADVDITGLYRLGNGSDANGFIGVLERAYSTGGRPPTVSTARHRCDECNAEFGSATGLTAHKRKVHAEPVSVSKDPWIDPNEEVSALSQLAADALACVSLASTDPEKAIVEAAQIRARLEDQRKIINKVESYLSTVDMMVDED